MQTVFKRLKNKIDTTGYRYSPHTMRHSMAIQFIDNGGDRGALQDILGHSTSRMTDKYVNLSTVHLQKQHKKASPMDNMD